MARIPALISYVDCFMQRCRIFPNSGKAWVAVSGGPDSMGLLFILSQLKQRGRFSSLGVLHVNHGTRKGHFQEEKLVADFCLKLNLPLIIYRIKKMSHHSNFEHLARQQRYHFFHHHLGPGDLLYTAHHIDDSFEWSLLHSLKGSKLSACLGIATRNGPIGRPLMCLTKNQLRAFVIKNKIPYALDPTNQQDHYERNYLRSQVIAPIKKAHPQYLKHYVYRSNILAKKLKLSLLNSKKTNGFLICEGAFNSKIIIDSSGQSDFSEAREKLLSLVKQLSTKERGVVQAQLDKAILALQKGKYGPLSFSGGVQLYMIHSAVMLIQQAQMMYYQKQDTEWAKRLKENTQIPDGEIYQLPDIKAKIIGSPAAFPYFFISYHPPKQIASLKRIHPLFPQLTAELLKQKIWFQIGPNLLKSGKNSSSLTGLSLDLHFLGDIFRGPIGKNVIKRSKNR